MGSTFGGSGIGSTLGGGGGGGSTKEEEGVPRGSKVSSRRLSSFLEMMEDCSEVGSKVDVIGGVGE